MTSATLPVPSQGGPSTVVEETSDFGERGSPEGPEAGPGRWWPALVCLGVYAALAAIDFGHFQSLGPATMVGPRNADQIAQVWWLAWAQFALAHGHSPFFTDWQNFPVGFNFGMNGSMFALGVPFSPLTTVFGPVVTWNVLLRLSLVVSAFSMCLVLRRFTTWWPAAFAGGLLYGFSCYETGNAAGYLFLVFVPLPPLILLLFYEILVRQRWNAVWGGVLFALSCTAQYLIFAEVLAATVLMGAVASGLYLLFNRRSVSLKSPYLRTAGISAVIAGVLAAGFPLVFTFFGPQHAKGPPNSPTALAQLHGDLLGPFMPGYAQRLNTPHFRSVWLLHLTNSAMMYMGVPLFVAIVVTVYLLRRRGIVLMCGVMAGFSLILSMGSVLYVNGRDTNIPLPFVVLANFPILNGLLSTRLSLFTFLFGSAVIAIGVDVLHRRLRSDRSGGSSSRLRRAAAAAAAMTLVAVVAAPMLPYRSQPTSPTGESAFFASTASARIPTGSVVLAYPYPDAPFLPARPGHPSVYTFAPINNALVDQAVSGMRFKIVGGYSWRPTKGTYGSPHPSRLLPVSVPTLFTTSFFGYANPTETKILEHADLAADLRLFLRRYQVDTVVVLPLGHDPALVRAVLTAAIGPPTKEAGGALVWFNLQDQLKT